MGTLSELWTRMTRVKGRATRPIADAAGDRRSEAKNALEAQTGHRPEPRELHDMEQETRRKHGDLE
jgi:hypothetical protein